MMDLLTASPPFIITLFLGVVWFVVKNHSDKVQKLEEKINGLVTETEVRQILIDKIEPIKEDIGEIRDNIRLITEELTGIKVKVQ